MSRDNYGRNPQEAAIRTASSFFNYGVFCMNKCAEEYSNLLNLSNYFSRSYMDIFYGEGNQAEKTAAGLDSMLNTMPEPNAPDIVIPIHEIKETVYDNKKIEATADTVRPMVQN